MQVSCVNPNGSAAGSEGWSNLGNGQVSPGWQNDTNCAPGVPMIAAVGDTEDVPDTDYETLVYTPPNGSQLVGGTVDVSLLGTGTGTASGDTRLFSPAFIYPDDVFFQCSDALGCNGGFSGAVNLPNDLHGAYYEEATCGGGAGGECTSGGTNGAYATAELVWAHFLLLNGSAPTASGFGGSALQRDAGGTAHVVLTASDAGGPGIYEVTASVGGHRVYAGTPNRNDGRCVPVGSDDGALMFDSAQPCPRREVIDVPVRLTGVRNGRHELRITLYDAAGNRSRVLDQTISVENPVATHTPRRHAWARFSVTWHWRGTVTTARAVSVSRLPARTGAQASCTGPGCPDLRVTSASGARAARALLRDLPGRRFHSGDALLLTFRAPRHAPERVRVTIRDGRHPVLRLLAG